MRDIDDDADDDDDDLDLDLEDDDDRELSEAEAQWRDGGSALPLIRLHIDRGDGHVAAVIARLVLASKDCPDAGEIERLLDSLDDAPPEWEGVLRDFVANPSLERWRELLQFVPPDDLYQRQRNSIRRLRQLGLPGKWLFLCACEYGITPDAIEAVEEGLVDVATIEERAQRAGGAKSTYYGLAAIAAFVSGDVVAMIRLLRAAIAHDNDLVTADPHIHFIRERASPEVTEALDRAGIPKAFER